MHARMQCSAEIADCRFIAHHHALNAYRRCREEKKYYKAHCSRHHVHVFLLDGGGKKADRQRRGANVMYDDTGCKHESHALFSDISVNEFC